MKWLSRLLNQDNVLADYSYVAEDWDSCAVGEFRKKFPNVVLYNEALDPPSPKDRRLLNLGFKFFHAVLNGNRPASIKLYCQIERRVIALANRG